MNSTILYLTNPANSSRILKISERNNIGGVPLSALHVCNSFLWRSFESKIGLTVEKVMLLVYLVSYYYELKTGTTLLKEKCVFVEYINKLSIPVYYSVLNEFSMSRTYITKYYVEKNGEIFDADGLPLGRGFLLRQTIDQVWSMNANTQLQELQEAVIELNSDYLKIKTTG